MRNDKFTFINNNSAMLIGLANFGILLTILRYLNWKGFSSFFWNLSFFMFFKYSQILVLAKTPSQTITSCSHAMRSYMYLGWLFPLKFLNFAFGLIQNYAMVLYKHKAFPPSFFTQVSSYIIPKLVPAMNCTSTIPDYWHI